MVADALLSRHTVDEAQLTRLIIHGTPWQLSRLVVHGTPCQLSNRLIFDVVQLSRFIVEGAKLSRFRVVRQALNC